jgi:glycosyltransferase involved in cell wall biosynthesis
MRPLVTIAIPTLNRLHYLKEAANSALSQTYENIEVLIGDDGQTESIRNWSENITRLEPKLRYQRNERNLGLAGNWNALADAARGEFLVIIGDDDRLLPDFVSKLVNAILPDATVAFSNLHLINSEGGRLEAATIEHARSYNRDSLVPGEVVNAEAVVWQNSVPISAALMRTSDVRGLRFKEDLNTPEIEFFIRLAQGGGKFVFVPDYLSEYRVHPHSETALGLRGERLAEYLLKISVAPDIEPYKRAFMASLLINSISRCLQYGEWDRARRLLSSEYYPRLRIRKPQAQRFTKEDRLHIPNAESRDKLALLRYFLRRSAQSLCAGLPEVIGRPAYRLMQGLNFRFKKIALHLSTGTMKTNRSNR